MRKKEKVNVIREYFTEEYGDVPCTLTYQSPFELLIAAMLAAQCTDARVNLVTPALFARFPTVHAFAEAEVAEVEEYVRSTGFFRNKAKNIVACAQMLERDFECIVPDTMEDLLLLPGVGRKIANLILGDVYHKPCIVVDTHCMRISKLLGLSDGNNPQTIEMDLKKIVPSEYGSMFCHQMVEHGRRVCVARRPKCEECGLCAVCRDFQQRNRRKK